MIVIKPDSILYNEKFCDEHKNPIRFCVKCHNNVIKELDIHKDIKCHISDNYLSSIEKFPFIIHEEEDDDMEGCFRTYMAFTVKKVRLSDGMFYFCDCSKEFMFGFLSYLSFTYCSYIEDYLKKYRGRTQYELDWEFTLPIDYENLTVMTSYNNDGYFHVYLTSSPEDFTKGWNLSKDIILGVCKYYPMSDSKIYQDEMKFHEIRKYI